jgi:16S rRNA (guanine527-N7)-methyltransferase
MMALSRDMVGGLDVSRETMASLRLFEAEVRRWTPVVNLISRGSTEDLWGRHIEDSAQIFRACPPSARHWLDLGSGGGFPGLVVAVLARELRPDLRVSLVEADQRKAVFLRQTALKLGLDVVVLAERIESLAPQGADVISARALAPLVELLDLAVPHLKPDGIALFPKGARHAEEVAEARTSWAFDLDSLPSALNPDAALLILRKVHRAQLP